MGDGDKTAVRFRGQEERRRREAVTTALGQVLEGKVAEYLHKRCGIPEYRPIDGTAVLEFLRTAVEQRVAWEDQVADAIGDVLNTAGPFLHDSRDEARAAREQRHAAMRAAWESRLPPQVAVPDFEDKP
jgi:hypothetical protein